MQRRGERLEHDEMNMKQLLACETFLKKMSLNMVNIECDNIFSFLFLDEFLSNRK